MCACICMLWMPQNVSGGQRTAFWSWFFPQTCLSWDGVQVVKNSRFHRSLSRYICNHNFSLPREEFSTLTFLPKKNIISLYYRFWWENTSVILQGNQIHLIKRKKNKLLILSCLIYWFFWLIFYYKICKVQINFQGLSISYL